MNLFGKSSPACRTLIALAVALTGLAAGAHAQSTAQVDAALADLYPAITNFETPALVATSTNTVATAAQLQAAFQLIASGTGTSVIAAGHSNHLGFGDPQDVAADISLASSALGAQSGDTVQVGMLAGYYAATFGDNALLIEYLPAVTASAVAYGNFTTAEADTAESTIVGDAITDSKSSAAAILDAALAVTDPAASAQATLFVAKAATAGIASLNTLAASLASSGAITGGSTGAFLAYAVKDEAAPANQVSLLEGYTTGASDSTLETTASNIITAANAASIPLLNPNLESIFTGLTSGGADDTAVVQGVVKAVLASSFFTTTALESTYVGDLIAGAHSQMVNILSAALAFNGASPTAQVTIFTGNTTTTLLGDGGLTLSQVATDIGATQDVAGGAFTSSTAGAFLEGVIKAESTSSSQQAFLESYIAGATGPGGPTVSQLATTATNIIAAAPSTFSAVQRMSVFTGLVTAGTINNDNTLAAVLPGIVTGILVGQNTGTTPTADDTALTSLVDGVTGMISAYPSEANLIAKYAATTLQVPANDLFAFTSGVLGNTNVKGAAGTNGIVDVTQAISDDFTLTNVTVTTGNILEKEAAVDAGLKALSPSQVLSGSAAQLVSQAAAQVLSTVATNGATALTTFATNFIAAVDATGNPNFAAITANDRAYAAIGLAEACDTDGVTGGSVAVATAAVATFASTITDLNDVAQPILEYFNANNTGTEVGNIAAAISQIAGSTPVGNTTVNYSPSYLAAQLILAAKTGTPPAANYSLVDQIALGIGTSSAVLADGYSGSKDTFMTSLADNLGTAAALPLLKNIATYLAGTSPYTDTEIVGDIASGLTTVSNTISAESGTVAAVVAAAHTADAAAIAAAAAGNVSLDTVRDTIAEDVVQTVAGSAPAVSGSVGIFIALADKGVFAEDLVKLDSNVTDDGNIALNVIQGVSSTDSIFLTDISTITEAAVAGLSTANKTSANVANMVYAVAFGYNGSLSGHPGDPLGGSNFANVASYAETVAAGEAALTTLSNSLAAVLIPGCINAARDSLVTAQLIAAQFTTDLPKAALAIATAATSNSLYGSYNPEESGSIGAAVAVALPTSGAFTPTVDAALSGSIAVISAVAGSGASPSQAATNTSLQDVAGIFASYTATGGGMVQTSAYQTVAASLSTYALVTGGTANALKTLTIPSIFEAFASPTTLGSTAASANIWLTKFLSSASTLGNVHDYYNAADIFGVALESDTALDMTSVESALVTDIANDIGTIGLTALINSGGVFTGLSTSGSNTAKAELISLLEQAETAAGNSEYGNITANETPIVNM